MLDINLPLLLITLVVFILLVRYLDGKLFNPLLKYMDDRDAMLRNDRGSVTQHISDIASLKHEAESILVEARKEASSLRDSIISEAKDSIAKRLEEKRVKLADSYREFERALSTEKLSLKNNLLADSQSFETALRERFSSI
jgi:F-type H+-transporting ATPase subunit b